LYLIPAMNNILRFDKQTGLIRLLVHLRKEGITHINKINKQTGMSYGTAYKCINILKTFALIIEKDENGGESKRRQRVFSLTEKGVAVAVLFQKIDELDKTRQILFNMDRQTGLIKTLNYIYKNDKAYSSELKEKGKVNASNICISFLDRWGMVEEKLEFPKGRQKGYRVDHFYLTDRGKYVGKQMEEIGKIIDGNRFHTF